jgi:NitT/TauT family transport system substrate-binding protein
MKICWSWILSRITERFWRRLIAAGILLSLLGLGLGPDRPAAAAGLTRVSFLPQWVPQAQFAGYYVALETGIYRRHGLDVQIIDGGPNHSPVDLLLSAKVDFASFWLVTGLELRSRGVAVVNLAQIVQRSALMLVAKKKNGIFKPADLNGRRVSLWGPPFAVQPRAFFERLELDVKPLRQSYSVNLFLRDGVAAASAMWYNEYHTIINSGLDADELTTFFFADYGLNYPEDGIYALAATQARRPEICRAFVKASLEGWRRAFAEPELALDITMANLRRCHIITNRVHQRWMLERMRDIILPEGEKTRFGYLRQEDFNRVVKGLQEQKVIGESLPYREFFRPLAEAGAQ